MWASLLIKGLKSSILCDYNLLKVNYVGWNYKFVFTTCLRLIIKKIPMTTCGQTFDWIHKRHQTKIRMCSDLICIKFVTFFLPVCLFIKFVCFSFSGRMEKFCLPVSKIIQLFLCNVMQAILISRALHGKCFLFMCAFMEIKVNF